MLTRLLNGLVHRYKQLTFRPYVIQRHVCGDEIRFLIGDLFGEGWYGPHHDPWPELQWIKDHGIQRGDVVIDCGANHGFSTVLFSKWTGVTGMVHAIEPTQHNLEILGANLRLNNISNAVVHPVAAGESNGPIRVTDHPNASVTNDPSMKAVPVEMRRLDDEIDDSQVNFIKIDVEGYELQVLEGASRILQTRPRLALELHINMYREPVRVIEQIFEKLSSLGYSMFVQTKVDGPICSFDDQRHSRVHLAECEIVHLFCL